MHILEPFLKNEQRIQGSVLNWLYMEQITLNPTTLKENEPNNMMK